MTLQIGKPAPAFKLDAVHESMFKTLALDDFKGKWTFLLFYPLDFTFVCPTELLAFSDRLDEFHKLGAVVVGASIDSKFSHFAWTQQPRKQGGIEQLRFPLLSDMNRTLSADYGVLTDEGVALRGLFLIDPDGVVQHATVNNLGVGRSVDEAIRVLQAFQHVREHGEVCPANWKPGEATMKPDTTESKSYFAAHAR